MTWSGTYYLRKQHIPFWQPWVLHFNETNCYGLAILRGCKEFNNTSLDDKLIITSNIYLANATADQINDVYLHWIFTLFKQPSNLSDISRVMWNGLHLVQVFHSMHVTLACALLGFLIAGAYGASLNTGKPPALTIDK